MINPFHITTQQSDRQSYQLATLNRQAHATAAAFSENDGPSHSLTPRFHTVPARHRHGTVSGAGQGE